MKKEFLSFITVKTLLAVVIFMGLGTIIIGGGYLIGEYCKNQDNQFIKPLTQEVIITTDKTEYDLKEYIIKVVIKNNSSKTIVYQAPYFCTDASLGLEKFVDNSWEPDSFPSAWCVAKNKMLNSDSTITITVELNRSEEYQKSGIYRISFKYIGKVDYSNKFTIKERLDKKTAIEKVGRVYVVGNEPFTNLALEVEGDETYCLIGPKFDELWNLQGKDVIVKGNIDKKHGCFIGKTISVTSFIIKEKIKKDIYNWQTYQNKEYGLEMKYPEDWEKINKTPAIMSFASKNRDNKNNIIQIRSMDRENDISLIRQIKREGDVEPELIKINNKDFYFFKTLMTGLIFYEYYIENKNKIFIISMVNMFADLSKNAQDESDIKYPTDEEFSEELNILRTMVSTFKFIEK